MTSLAGLILLCLIVTPAAADARRHPAVFPPDDCRRYPLSGTGFPTWNGTGQAPETIHPVPIQPVRVDLPSTGQVTIYTNASGSPLSMAAPARMNAVVGHSYRLRLSNMPEYPGIELYPTVEIIDRLHPPAGKAEQFPIPVQFTAEDIHFAVKGNFITKVVYLEDPRIAPARAIEGAMPVATIAAHKKVVGEAARLGRPLAILRLGGRIPAAHTPDPAFFGMGTASAYPNTRLR